MSIKSSMFTAFADIYSSAEANTEGSAAGWRPEAGDHAVLVTGMVADSGVQAEGRPVVPVQPDPLHLPDDRGSG
jgi:hypothetical protein